METQRALLLFLIRRIQRSIGKHLKISQRNTQIWAKDHWWAYLSSSSCIKSVPLKKQASILVALYAHARMSVHVDVFPSYLCSHLSRPRFESRADGPLLFKCGPFINCIPKQPPWKTPTLPSKAGVASPEACTPCTCACLWARENMLTVAALGPAAASQTQQQNPSDAGLYKVIYHAGETSHGCRRKEKRKDQEEVRL